MNADPDLKFRYSNVHAMVRYFALNCFACEGREGRRFAPDSASLPVEPGERPSKELYLVPGDRTFGTWPVYRLPDEPTLEEFLKAADEHGWRKLTMYGKTLYICPAGREQHKRARPEWERRLVEA